MVFTILTIIYLINAIAAGITILMKPRDVAAIWAWLLVLISIPVGGFVIYLFVGRGLGDKKNFKLDQSDQEEIDKLRDFQGQAANFYGENGAREENENFVQFFSNLNNLPITEENDVEIITDGTDKFQKMLADFRAAKFSIHIEYYAFVTDEVGSEILKVLEEKAAEGVEVCLLYDAFGSLGTKDRDFKKLRSLGGMVQTYITSQRSLMKLRLNYHNHRKIVVVDGTTSYIGGFNVANQYAGVTKKFGYWRDTHLRIQGPAASLLQIRFIRDWNVSRPHQEKLEYKSAYFYRSEEDLPKGDTAIQIIASGPNNEDEQIKLAFIKLITSAKRRLWLQTPYLVPDDSVLAALRIAARSGVDVKIMIPDKPDHPFIYRATQYYGRQLIKEDIEILIYEGGFMHAKTLIMDDDICIVGSANQDIRSYKLNFEASAVLHDPVIVGKLAKIFEADQRTCSYLTPEVVKEMSPWLIFKQQISRLLSPIL
ncbi:cardiolipin synthase [Vagococcus salmoninarum]|uniref:cardiolipin synthase n=1 Tax=Vagococcus salmoninarum TaxID=2739 RepID=UPI0018811160|nr:cardiolipin synthase [Vagococcus salmoninarum]MBE9388153.1 cardiolipin synthase [Vagococcus salmoninarum]